MGLALVTVCDSISRLVVQGLTIADIDELTPSATRKCPILFPKPDGFVTNFTVTRETWNATNAALNVEYDLTYTFCFQPLGTDRLGFEQYGEMVSMALTICDAAMVSISLPGAGDTYLPGVVKFDLVGPLNFGPVSDPAGALYHGCQFVFHVLEFVN